MNVSFCKLSFAKLSKNGFKLALHYLYTSIHRNRLSHSELGTSQTPAGSSPEVKQPH